MTTFAAHLAEKWDLHPGTAADAETFLRHMAHIMGTPSLARGLKAWTQHKSFTVLQGGLEGEGTETVDRLAGRAESLFALPRLILADVTTMQRFEERQLAALEPQPPEAP